MSKRANIDLIGYQPFYSTLALCRDDCETIIRRDLKTSFIQSGDILYLMHQAFVLGMMQGKRAERAKRKAGGSNE